MKLIIKRNLMQNLIPSLLVPVLVRMGVNAAPDSCLDFLFKEQDNIFFKRVERCAFS